MQKIIFIDRDGVINVDPIGDYIKRWEDFRFESGALEGLQKLSQAGYQIVIISNQAGVGDGVYPEAELRKIHTGMLELFQKAHVNYLDAFYCLHGKQAGCGCRKPKTGLFEQAAARYRFDRAKTYFIGDKATDIEAGKKFGLKTIFVLTGHGPQDESKLKEAQRPDLICDSLYHAAVQLTS